jgi:aryl-alcohol dehydrogenase-like predicted oxidoreductase
MYEGGTTNGPRAANDKRADAAAAIVLRGRAALGGATLSLDPRLAHNRELGESIVREAYDRGVRIFDSARAYAPVDDPAHNERLMMHALAGCDDAIIATKGGHWRQTESVFLADNRPERLRQDVEDSLRVLGVERLPLYYVHRADMGKVPIEESVAALEDLRREGKVARIGISNVTAAQVRRAAVVAPIAAVQNRLSARTRLNADVIDICAKLGIAVFGYAPLRFAPPDGQADLGQALPNLAREAVRRGVPLQRLALRGLLASSPVVSLVLGASRIETAQEIALVPEEPWDDGLETAFARDRAASS